MTLAHVALGANLGDPVAQIVKALDALAGLRESRLLRASSLYRTAPVGIRGQPDFINAVSALETRLEPLEMLEELFLLEARFGRRRDYRHAPRTLDLDLLLHGGCSVDTPRLQLPHPRMHLRAFVLAPLVEITPDCRIPGRGDAAAWRTATRLQRVDRIAA
ncbi:MAG: 2-amino-4-hydroxy-6-hydroxymethyldihydropteridine diphosphokinase [Candidatus Accumulibacter sp.]|jgi:2-amino-4-hydroxy-6-hydroxymethyldihydropteridine diphosphokinase|nr:2-amino-4-hydroxy-6-hydroxymethyldihydropteridine diphosphokinase [Accumulibacter sp.]